MASAPRAKVGRPANSTKEDQQQLLAPPLPRDALPHPAEDLSADDDLLSWILVDQLGCMPNTKLGVHPQQVKFVGPVFKTDEVLNIVKETVTKGNIQAAMQRLQEFHLIKSHLEAKLTAAQRDRFIQHMRRYLITLLPNSRIEIHATSRYSFITGHPELAVFATRPLESGIIMDELQGSVVPLPDQWREEMEIGDDFAVEAAGEESDSESDMDDNESVTSSAFRRDKGKSREVDGKRQGQRRSDRTKRRDFSIVWSGLKRCYQLFLGPARFLNHDCNPNVELLRQGKYVTFRVCRPIRVGEELTTFYGDNYFGRGNIECLCLTCEQTRKGGFTPGSSILASISRMSRASSTGSSPQGSSSTMRESVSRGDFKNPRPSSLRHEVNGWDNSGGDDSFVTAGPSHSPVRTTLERSSEVDGSNDADSEVDGDAETNSVSLVRNGRHRPLPLRVSPAPTSDSMASDTDSPADPPLRRQRSTRKVVQNMKPFSFLQRPKKVVQADPEADEEQSELTDEYPRDFPRCATCTKPLTDQIWFNGRYFEHCQRHALVFELPWPAHRPQDVQAYPPAHLVPSGYIPKRVTSIPLPTLSKAPRIKVVEVPVSPAAESRDQKRARKLREQIEAEEFFIGSLREAAWSVQEAKEAAVVAAEEAREAARLARIEAKRKRDEGKIKGTGVWQRYAYLTEEEMKRKQDEKNKVLSGTRRGGRFRAEKDEAEMKRLAEEKRRQEQEREAEEEHSDDESEQPAPPRETPVQSPRAQPEGSLPGKSREQGPNERAILPFDLSLCSVAALGPLATPSTATAPSKSGSPSTPASQRMKAVVTPSSAAASRRITLAGQTDVISISSSSEDRSRSVSLANSVPDSSSRRRGRPPGTGKRQRQAAAKLAKNLVKSQSSSPPDIVYMGRKSGPATSSKGKEKEIVDSDGPSPASLSSKRLSSGNGFDDGSPAVGSSNKKALDRGYDPAVALATYYSGIGRSKLVALPAATHDISPPSTASIPELSSTHRPRTSNGSGSSSVDAASSTLSNGSGESKTIQSSTRISPSAVPKNVKTVFTAYSRDENPFQALNALAAGRVTSKTEIALLSAADTPANAKAGEGEKKRKRVSDASDISSSPTLLGQEKKKRTFFPSKISVAVFKPTPPISVPKHSITKL